MGNNEVIYLASSETSDSSDWEKVEKEAEALRHNLERGPIFLPSGQESGLHLTIPFRVGDF